MTFERKKNKGGAPKGNQNARKHGFYSKTLTPRQQELFSQVSRLKSFGPEIALLRVKILSILENDPKNFRALNLALSSMANLLRTSQCLGKREDRALDATNELVSSMIATYAPPDNKPCPDLSRVGPIERSQEVVSRLISENNRA